MFKKLILVLFLSLVLILIIVFIRESKQNNPKIIYDRIFPSYQNLINRSLKDIVYSPERKMLFELRYLGVIPIGEAEMTVEDKGSSFVLRAVARPNEFIGNMYKVEATVQSIIDKDKLYPLKYTEILTTPEKKKTKEIIYYQDKHIMEREGKKYKILPMTFCPLSVFYYLQMQNLELGKTYEINVASKENVYLFKIETVEKKDKIFKLKGSVKRIDLSSSHGANFIIWLSEDLRVPLLVKVYSPVGIVIMRAKEVK